MNFFALGILDSITRIEVIELEEKIFTIRRKPKPGESLFSFLIRMAGANGLTLVALLTMIKSCNRKEGVHIGTCIKLTTILKQ
jgi:hypothetical protein